ncbi:MAG: GH3 auxin-responsive promoter family protein [Saprospiraceae bacterium]|nr:GH3 auxin-responsive promoter family protein [Saprospiraceae bacterium]
MKAWFNAVMRGYLGTKHRKLMEVQARPHEAQQKVLKSLLQQARNTEYGRRHGFARIRNARDFANQTPVVDYEVLKPSIDRMMRGEEDVLWPGRVHWYAKSSGTTSARSKFIPIPNENLKGCHHKSTWEALAMLYAMLPEATLFHRKNLVMGGSLSIFEEDPDTTYGDVSAIMLQHMPAVGRPFFTPDFETALLDDWEEKIERMVRICTKEDVSFIGGVPTWTIVLFKRILEATGADHMLQVWPHLQAYTHGGVGFKPYRSTFEQFIPKEDFVYQEVYNASEGFFAAQDRRGADDMLLLLDNGMYFEFLPMSEWGSAKPIAISLQDVKAGTPYALVISTNAGLWRYIPGDTIQFTTTQPYRIQVTGRTQQFINAFGEEVMIANTEMALLDACEQHDALVADYTVAPVYLNEANKGRHEWLIEFLRRPGDARAFAATLDRSLQQLNSDYEAKRSADLALEQLDLKVLPEGTFERWLAARNKLGGQNKVPRLSNDRTYVEEILNLVAHEQGA